MHMNGGENAQMNEKKEAVDKLLAMMIDLRRRLLMEVEVEVEIERSRSRGRGRER